MISKQLHNVRDNMTIMLNNLSDCVDMARQGDSKAQKELADAFASGEVIARNDKISKFWSDLSDESKFYRISRHILNSQQKRPLTFLSVESDYARNINVTPSFVIEEAADATIELIERHKKRTSLTYVVIISGYDKSKEMLAMMGARAVLGWTSSKVRTIFASLPFKVTDFMNKDDALNAVCELKNSSVTASLQIINGLGEDVTNSTPSQSAMNFHSSEKVQQQASKWPKFCNKCGNKLSSGAKFCNMCGNRIIVKE